MMMIVNYFATKKKKKKVLEYEEKVCFTHLPIKFFYFISLNTSHRVVGYNRKWILLFKKKHH